MVALVLNVCFQKNLQLKPTSLVFILRWLKTYSIYEANMNKGMKAKGVGTKN